MHVGAKKYIRKRKKGKDLPHVVRDRDAELPKTETTCADREIPSRLLFVRRYVSPSTDECNFSRMLRRRKSTGSRKRDRRIREMRERGTKLRPDARLACSRKQKSTALSHSRRGRLMPFDESRCPSLSRIIVAIPHISRPCNICVTPLHIRFCAIKRAVFAR